MTTTWPRAPGSPARYVATAGRDAGRPTREDGGIWTAPAYERWVAGYDVETGQREGAAAHRRARAAVRRGGRQRTEDVVAGRVAAPGVAAAYDAAQDRAAEEIIGWLAEHATTRVGPRGRQVQVPVEQLEAAVVRHHTSRAGDPHRHLHLQVNARVFAAGRWRGLHSVGVVDSIEAINGIGHAAVMCDPQFRQALAAHGYTLDPATGEVRELAPYAGAFSARAHRSPGTSTATKPSGATEHPGEEPGPQLRRGWDRRAWAEARPDKVVPTDGATCSRRRWVEELHELGFTPPARSPASSGHPSRLDTDRPHRPRRRHRARPDPSRSAALSVELRRHPRRGRADHRRRRRRDRRQRCGASWPRTSPPAPSSQCVPLLDRADVPEHIRALTSPDGARRRGRPGRPARRPVRRIRRARTARPPSSRGVHLDHGPAARSPAPWPAPARLVVIEGAAGAGKTTTLAAARDLVELQRPPARRRHAHPEGRPGAEHQLGTGAFSAAWLVHQHGFRWDADGRWHEYDAGDAGPDPLARLLPGDLLLVDEAGMLDQDTAHALLTIADEAGARIAFVGDRHQLPAVGRGGVLDHAARWARDPTATSASTQSTASPTPTTPSSLC